MTREEAKQNLIGFGIAEPTAENITHYLNQIGAETKSYKDKIASYAGKDERIAELEQELEKIHKQNMTDIELANAEKEEALKREALANKKILEMQTKAELANIGIVGELADKLISNGTIDFATLGQIISEREKSAVSEFEKANIKNTPNPNNSTGGNVEIQKTEAEKVAESLGKFSSSSNKDSESIINSYK